MNASRYPAWAMLAALTAAFALSHAFRTVVTLVALPLRSELGLGNDTIAFIGGAFHITFGAMQLPMGEAR
jgi:sugar phosphate permease